MTTGTGVDQSQEDRPALRRGWFWDDKRITSDDGCTAYWVEDGNVFSSDAFGIPAWVFKALEADEQL